MSEKELTRDDVLGLIETTWNDLQTSIANLTDDQLTRPTDAAGWTAKDHLMHIAIFDQAELAILERRSKREMLDIPQDMWDRGEDVEINGMLQQRYHNLPLSEVMDTLRDSHDRMMQKLTSMSEADLALPYSHYQLDSEDSRPLLKYIPWDTAYHYRDHIPWIATIVANA